MINKTVQRVVQSALVLAVGIQVPGFGQTPKSLGWPEEILPVEQGANVPGCTVEHRTVAFKDPRVGKDGKILPGQVLVRGRLTLDSHTTARIVEYPRYGGDLDSYNSTVIVRRGQQQTKYSIGQLIKYGSGLRLVEIASLCDSSDQGTVILAFEAGSTGSAEGFAVIRHSLDTVDVRTFPLVTQGRIVIKPTVPDEVELWSTTQRDASLCEACKKHYVIQDCHVGQQSVECKQRPGPGEILSPDKFMRARIEVR